MSDFPEPLLGLTAALSISESSGSTGQGSTVDDVNCAVSLLSTTLLEKGAFLAFGHDWRAGGVMEQVLQTAGKRVSGGVKSAQDQPAITNFVAWPRESSLSEEERARMADIVQAVNVPLPGELEAEAARSDEDSRLRTFLTACALTYMRHRLIERVDAVVCIGGRVSGSVGRFAGVAEEAFLAARAGRPLYISGLFGGASQQVIQAIQGEGAGLEAFNSSPEVSAAWEAHQGLLEGVPWTDRCIGEAIAESLGSYGLQGLSDSNCLSTDENLQLFEAKSLDEFTGLLLTGLLRLRQT